MESSTIVRILEIPTGGIDPSELSSGSLLYVENVGTDGLGGCKQDRLCRIWCS